MNNTYCKAVKFLEKYPIIYFLIVIITIVILYESGKYIGAISAEIYFYINN